MSLPLLTEATVLDDSGVLVVVWHVDTRCPRNRTPVATLVKAGHKEHAIAEPGTIRISKPVCFRSSGEGLIMDPAETLVSRNVVTSERIDAPDDLADARRFNDELERCGAAIGRRVKTTTKSISTTNKSTRTLTYGRNGWIYSTSVEPGDGEEIRRWKASLPKEYDHVVGPQSRCARRWSGRGDSYAMRPVGGYATQLNRGIRIRDRTIWGRSAGTCGTGRILIASQASRRVEFDTVGGHGHGEHHDPQSR